jgi:hypothetical protein
LPRPARLFFAELMKNRIYFVFSLIFFLLFSCIMGLHFHIVWVPLFCLLAGLLVRIAFHSAYLTIFSFLIPILPALSVFENKGFPLNYLLLPIFFLCGMVAGEFAVNKNRRSDLLPELPKFYFTLLLLLGISFLFIILRWSNLTLSPLAFFKDSPVAPTGQRISFGIIFPVVETALFLLSPFYFLMLQRAAEPRRVLIAFLSGQSLSILFSLLQRLQGSVSVHLSLRGLASDPTAFGFLSAFSILLAWYLYFHYTEKWLGIFFVAISMVGILNSSTRIGLFAIVLVIFLFIFFNQKKIVPAILIVIFLAAILFSYIYFFPQPGSNLLARLKSNILDIEQFQESIKTEQVLSRDLSAHRDVLGKYVWECLKKFPITGVGTGNFVFWVMSAHFGDYFHHLPANQYFFFTSSQGLPGLLIFLFFYFALFSLKKWPEKCLLAILLFFFLFNDYLWFPEIILAFWLVASLGEEKQVKPFVPSKAARIFLLGMVLLSIIFNFLRFSDLHPKTWALKNSTSYDYGLSYIEHEKGQQFQWTGEKAGIYIYLDKNGRNNNFRLACGAPLAALKNRKQTVDIYFRGRLIKRATFNRYDEYPIFIEDKECREGFLEFRVRPVFNLNQMHLGNETRTLGIKLFGGDIPGIHLLSPNGHENWLPGSAQDIRWQSKGKITAVKIEISYNGGGTYLLIGDSIANLGHYSWKVASGPSANCVLRVSGESGAVDDASDQPFAIAASSASTGNSFVLFNKWIDAPYGSDGWYVGDFNGDKRSDIMRVVPNVSGGQVYLSDGTKFVDAGSWTGAGNGADGWTVGDFNGDGRSDLMRHQASSSENDVFLSDGSRFVGSGNWLTGGNGADGWYVGDFNGDGRADILRYLAEFQENDVFLSDGTRFVGSGNWLPSDNGAYGWTVGDFNGDGRSDLMRIVPGTSGAEVFLSDGAKFVYTKSWTGANPGENGWYAGDFNGDKNCDIMRYIVSLSGIDVFLAGKTKFFHDGNWSGAGIANADWYIGDFNGDGRADLLRNIVYALGTSEGDVLLSVPGNAFFDETARQMQNNLDSGLWMADLPSTELTLNGTKEKAFADVIRNRILGGEKISIYQIQKEYEKLQGRYCRRVEVLRFLKHYKLNQSFGRDIPGIQLLSPNGGENWSPASVLKIRWQYQGMVATVKIEISYDGGRTYKIIGSCPADRGIFSWKTGNTPSMNCMIKISNESGSMADACDHPFAIAAAPSLAGFSFSLPLQWTDASSGSDGWYIGDFNGDKRSDILRLVPGVSGGQVYLSDGTKFVDAGSWTGAGNGADGWYVGDFNGDGRSDIMRHLANGSENEVFLSDGSKFVAGGNWITSGNGADGWYVGDFNGDGRSDILRYLPNQLENEVFLSDGSKFMRSGNWLADGNGVDGWFVGDFNSDGRSDLMRVVPEKSGAEVFLSTGAKFVRTKSWTGADPGEGGWYLGDFNGDKRCDIMRYAVSLSGVDVFLAGNKNFIHDGNWSNAGKGDADWYIGDFNGDGRADLLRNVVYGVGVSRGEVLLSVPGSRPALRGNPSGLQKKWDNGRWLADVPSDEGNVNGPEEAAFIKVIKNRISGGENVSIFEIQKEYEKLKGKKFRRLTVLRLLKLFKLQP